MVTITISKTSDAFFHDEDEEVHPKSRIAPSTQLEYKNPLRDLFSGLTFGVVAQSSD